MAAGDPDTWDPFAEASRLERAGPGKLRIADQSSYDAPGELVRFHTEGGTVATMSWAGMTLCPEDTWFEAKRDLRRHR